MKDQFISKIPKDSIGPKLIELAEKDDRIVVFSSDVSVSCNVEMFNKRFPRRFFEMGIAEQSTMSCAAGIASEGFIPVYVALAIFSCGMTWPQMRQMCNNNFGVKIIGTHAGVDDGQDGSGHHATEDIATSRVIPRMTVLTPSDEAEVAAAVEAMIQYPGPVYMRVAREDQPVIHDSSCVFTIGKVEEIENTGDEFAIVYEGTALKQALEGYRQLSLSGRKGRLVSIRTIKPIDREYIEELADRVGVIVTVENHSIVGGLYSAVAETLAGRSHKAIVRPVGFKDEFTESGSSKDIKEKYGLTAKAIVDAVTEFK